MANVVLVMNWTRTWAWMLACIVLASCAQVGSPSGGPKDETPPELISALPALGATEVGNQRLVLEFDEYVKGVQLEVPIVGEPPP